MIALINSPVLVLNKNWQPVDVATLACALTHLFKENAVVIDPSDYSTYNWDDWSSISPEAGEKFLQTTSVKLRIPEIIRLNDYDKLPESAVTFSRRNLFKRDHYVCQYCHKQPGTDELTIDHVNPRSLGGQSTWENCVLACIDCNTKKADRPLKVCGMKLLREPVRPTWKPLYAAHDVRLQSWSKFVSEAYWEVPLKE